MRLKHDEKKTLTEAALQLRQAVLDIKVKPQSTRATVGDLKAEAPKIPEELEHFYTVLMHGTAGTAREAEDDLDITSDMKVSSMASDAIFNCTRGAVKPLKQVLLGLSIGTITGSKTTLEILNRLGHFINLENVKYIETELAYSYQRSGHKVPDESPVKHHLCSS